VQNSVCAGGPPPTAAHNLDNVSARMTSASSTSLRLFVFFTPIPFCSPEPAAQRLRRDRRRRAAQTVRS